MQKEEVKKMKKVDTNIEDWKEGLKKTIGYWYMDNGHDAICPVCGIDADKLIDFIQSLLEQERKKVVKLYERFNEFEQLKMVRGLVGLDKHENREYLNIKNELSKLK
jgi:hypothetical protein